MIDLQLLAVGALASVAISVGAYFKGLDNGKELMKAEYLVGVNDLLQQQKKVIKQNEILKEELLTGTAYAISQIEVKNEVIYNKTVREVIKEPVYTECEFTPDVLLNVNEALTNGRDSDSSEVQTEPSSKAELP